jgi:TPR repeat protein
MMKKFDIYFNRASEYLDDEKFKKALMFFLKAEKLQRGDVALNIGYTYDEYSIFLGKKSKKKSKKWFKKAIKYGDFGGITSIAIMYRELYKFKKSKKWFKKAIKYGDNETSYELAKLYLMEGKIKKATKLLEIFEGDRLKLNISEGGQEDGLKLLHKIKRDIN